MKFWELIRSFIESLFKRNNEPDINDTLVHDERTSPHKELRDWFNGEEMS